MAKPVAQAFEKQEPEDPQVSGEPVLEPSSSEQTLALQPEPTVTFLFTLLSTAEPTESKDPEGDGEFQEYQFLDEEDWGPRRTSKEINHLQNDCMSIGVLLLCERDLPRRLRESLSTMQADNLALGEKLRNLPSLSSKSLKEEAEALQEEVMAVHKGAQAIQEGAQAGGEDAQAVQGVALSPGHWQPPCGTWGGREGLPSLSVSSPLL